MIKTFQKKGGSKLSNFSDTLFVQKYPIFLGPVADLGDTQLIHNPQQIHGHCNSLTELVNFFITAFARKASHSHGANNSGGLSIADHHTGGKTF